MLSRRFSWAFSVDKHYQKGKLIFLCINGLFPQSSALPKTMAGQAEKYRQWVNGLNGRTCS